MLQLRATKCSLCVPYGTGIYLRTLGRQYSGISNPFKILFLGRDEFSCTVLRHLHSAQGMCFEPWFTRFNTHDFPLIDVWSSIDIVTTPDLRVGRRGSKLAVCKFSYSLAI